MALNVLVIGGSRHIGYYSALRFLDAGSTVTFLLRSPATFDDDQTIQKYVKSGHARLIKGDGLVLADVQNVWTAASSDQPVDVVLFTIGFTGSANFHPIKGFLITPHNLVTQCLLNVLCEMPKTNPLPKVIILSTIGVTPSSRSQAPFLLNIVYGYMISHPLRDKLGAERVIYHCAGWNWNSKDGEPKEDIMGEGWKEREGLPAPGQLKNAMVLRPAMLNDGECVADSGKTPPYRAAEGNLKGWSVSRKDVAHFIFDAVTNHWDEYGNKQISIAY